MVAARNARGIFPSKLMIECELLSGLKLRHVQKPRADMVICRSGPNLNNEFSTLRGSLVFPIQICSIIAPIQVVAFTLPLAPTVQAYSTLLMPLFANAGSL